MESQHPTCNGLGGGSEMGGEGFQAVQCEAKADEAPKDVTMKQPSTKIQQENKGNKDATVSYQAEMATEEEVTIQTTPNINKKQESSSLVAESGSFTKNPKGGKCRQKTRHLDEVDESFPWGGKRKAPDEAVVPSEGDMPERENEEGLHENEGLHGLCSKRRAQEEMEDTNGNHESSRNQDWTKKMPFKQQFVSWGECYICSECGRTFNNLPDFQTHETSHLGANLYWCTKCSKGFSSLEFFTEHQRIHATNQNYKSMEGNFFKSWMMKCLQEAQDRQQASNAKNQNPEQTELSHSLSQPPIHLSCPCSPGLRIPVIQGNKPPMCPSCHSSLFVPKSDKSSPSLYFPPTHKATGSVSPVLSPSQITSPKRQWMMRQKVASSQVLPRLSSNEPWKMGQKVLSTQVLPGQEVTSAHSLAGQCEDKTDEAPNNPTTKQPSTEIQQENKENKDATVSSKEKDQTLMATEEGVTIQTTLDADKIQRPSSLVAESGSCTETPKGRNCQQKTCHLGKADEYALQGGKRKAIDETVVLTDMPERENDKREHGLCLKRTAPEEMKDTSADKDCSGKQENDWIKKPFEKGFSTSDKCYICSECGKSFNNLPDFETHQISHLGPCFYGCAACGKIFPSQATLTEHQRIHTTNWNDKPMEGDFFVPHSNTYSPSLYFPPTHNPTGSVSSFLSPSQRLSSEGQGMMGQKMVSTQALPGQEVTSAHSLPEQCEDKEDEAPNYPTTKQPSTEIQQENKENKNVTVSGDVPERENDKGEHGLCLKRTAPEEMKDTSEGQDFSWKQEKDWIMKPFEKGFSTSDKCYICSECGKSFNNLPDFEIHQTTHRGPCFYGCAACGKIFHSQANLTEHQIIHTANLPSTSMEENFFKPWMMKSLQEVQYRQQASNVKNQNPERTELPHSLSQPPIHLSCPCSPGLRIPVIQGNKPPMCPSCHSSLFVPKSDISSPSLYFLPTNKATGSVSPVLSPSQRPYSEGQWMMGQKVTSSQVIPGPSSNEPWKMGQMVSTQVLSGLKVTSAHSLSGQLERLDSPYPTHGPDFPQRSSSVWNYPCVEYDVQEKRKSQGELQRISPESKNESKGNFYSQNRLGRQEEKRGEGWREKSVESQELQTVKTNKMLPHPHWRIYTENLFHQPSTSVENSVIGAPATFPALNTKANLYPSLLHGERFGKSSILEIHHQIHEDTLSCTCGKEFKKFKYLKAHQKRHIQERVFLCSVCGRTFNDKYSCKTHEIQHAV
ncbi:uncharacterized protein LOC121921805 isoform X2 [Sceloporus undulatus]|uniref:uncharacterized protein LOC121921805 isoform X2 n=1 Tax=Sceloporus undulatus TaxID=8520 RepID=UPI001C4D0447|nr:uncharacterized protein LOC121921805 isoform X2 [Sceloporus undulatus]